MSAILKTLKKLEEEKNLVEQNLDIEDMVKQAEVMASSTTRRRKNSFVATLLGLTGVVITLYYVHQSKNPEQPAAESPVVTRPTVPPSGTKTVSVPKKAQVSERVQVASGIPLNQIPETETPIPAEEKTTVIEKKAEEAPRTPQPVEPPEEKTPVAKIIEETPPVALNEIHTLIEQAKLAADIQQVTPKIKPRRNTVYIPGLKVKGIVFLTANNPVNHILVSTPNEDNKKLKVGQSVLGAKLTAIHSNKTVFLYKGQTTETGIGE
ncbi:MAG: hypothetical protein VYC17_04200 [Nitrospinota bacterium]|nr:hypothetical protein [Nitrospinota bacterium]